MKKILLAVTAALAITGCSQNEEFDGQNASNEISIHTGVSNTARATMVTSLSFQNFTAYAYTHTDPYAGTGTAIMSAAAYTKQENTWSTTGKYYWPTSGNVTFFGYNATNVVFEKTENKAPTLTYSVKDNIVSQEDLVVAQLRDQSKSEKNSAVNLTFKHALTQVYFKLAAADPALTYKVTSIAIKGIQNKGTFTYGDPQTSIGTWETASESSSKEYTISYQTGAEKTFTGNNKIELTANDEVMVLLPQTLNEASISVKYSATLNGIEVHSATEPVSWNLSDTWSAGQKIAYVLTLSGDGITVTGDVDDESWTPKSDTTLSK